MSNRNFDNRVIIQRLQNQNYARNLYQYNTSGNRIISNPQNSDGTAFRFTTFHEGSETMYFRGLIGGGMTSSIGGTFGIPPPLNTAPVITPITSTIACWATSLNRASNENGIATDLFGNTYVVGQYISPLSINTYGTISSNGIIITSTFGQLVGTNTDAFIVKYNSSGVAQWATNISGTSIDAGYGIATDVLGNVYVTGEFFNSSFINSYSSISSGTIITSTFGQLVGSDTDAFIAKYTSSGIAQWATNIGATNSQIGRGIATDVLGNVYVTGQFFNSFFINSYSTISGGTIITSTFGQLVGTNGDAFIAKYTSSGVAQWATNIIGFSPDFGNGIVTDVLGSVYVTGQFFSSSFINSYSSISSGTIITSTFGQLVGRGNDAFIVKYTSSGVAQWATNVSGTSTDVGRGIATDVLSNVYVTGQFFNSTFINSYSSISSGTIITSTFGQLVGRSGDAFIAKYTSSGVAQWATNIGGTNSDFGNGIATDVLGSVYVTGQFVTSTNINTYNNISSGTIITNNIGRLIGGSSNAFIVKFNTDGQFVI